MIDFEDIEVSFGDFKALPSYTLNIKEGEFFTLLGPSGCGKSTALRTLAGFIQPSNGAVKIDGKDVTKLPSHKRRIGMVFQNYALFPTLSVGENIAFGLKTAKVAKSEVEQRVNQIAREVNLTPEQLQKNVADLSGGQQQRVAIARALVLRPKILLLDEPLSNLDAKLRHQLRIQLKDLQEQFGITTVYVTHDQDEALSMSDRLAVMSEGRIEQVGTPGEVYTSSATEFVCNFIGEANKLSPELISNISQRSATPLNPEAGSYVRVEKIRITESGKKPDINSTSLPGVVNAKRYHGVYSSYIIDIGGTVIKGMIQELGDMQFELGQKVDVHLNPQDILQFEGTS